MELLVVNDTVLKPSTNQASELNEAELAPVAKGTSLPILAYKPSTNNHLVITLNPEKIDLRKLHTSGRNTWYCFADHLEDPTGISVTNNPKDTAPAKVKNKGPQLILPGYQGTYYFGEAISSTTPDFTWGEALHFNGSTYRKPENASVVNNIIKIAGVMQVLRQRFGKPLIINSWYRDPATNRAVGGASRSQHMAGNAVDFSIPGMAPRDVYRALDSWWGNRGGLAYGNGFTHIDLGGARRWTYPGVR